jgi:hypothetical protein
MDWENFTRALGNRKDSILNSLEAWGKENVPSNMRLYAGTMLGERSPIDESYFKSEDLDAMRAAVKSSIKERKAKIDHYSKMAAEWAKQPPDSEAKVRYIKNPDSAPDAPLFIKDPSSVVTAKQRHQQILNEMQEVQRKPYAIQYGHYGQDIYDGINKEGWKKGIGDSFTNPSWRMATSIGRAVVAPDAQGNYILTDSYDWNNKKALEGPNSPGYILQALQAIGNPTTFGNVLGTYLAPQEASNRRQVRLNLGKIE